MYYDTAFVGWTYLVPEEMSQTLSSLVWTDQFWAGDVEGGSRVCPLTCSFVHVYMLRAL